MIELKVMLLTLMCLMGATQLSESSKKISWRKLEVEFGDLLQFEDLLDNSKLFIIPNNLSKLSLAREVAQVEVTQDNIGYLPTINSPATDMSTVQEVLVLSQYQEYPQIKQFGSCLRPGFVCKVDRDTMETEREI